MHKLICSRRGRRILKTGFPVTQITIKRNDTQVTKKSKKKMINIKGHWKLLDYI